MNKKLYKNDFNKLVCGVCSGIAEYFNIDATIVRVVWAFLLFFWGISLWIYIVLALILPNKSSLINGQNIHPNSGQDGRQNGPGFDTAQARDVNPIPTQRTDPQTGASQCGCNDGNFDSTSSSSSHGSSNAKYDEDQIWKESRKNSDGQWK